VGGAALRQSRQAPSLRLAAPARAVLARAGLAPSTSSPVAAAQAAVKGGGPVALVQMALAVTVRAGRSGARWVVNAWAKSGQGCVRAVMPECWPAVRPG
jgi:hypothetical protein